MLIGILEVVVVALAAIVFVPMALMTKKRWMILILASLLISMLITPADPVSLLLVGFANVIVSLLLYYYVEKLNRPDT